MPSSLPRPPVERRTAATAGSRRAPAEIIDPRWLLQAGALAVAVAAVCGYLTFCLIFWQGQWQFALHPTRTAGATPAAAGLPFEPLRIAPGASGTPELAAWWVPAETPSAPTALLLHAGDGDLSDTLPTLAILHAVGLNTLAFDYRGFGSSTGKHPTEQTMQADAAAALSFLQSTRHLSAAQIVPVGVGVGASLAVALCAAQHDLPACILLNPDGDLDARIRADPRTRILPVSLLLDQHFALQAPLSTLRTPKLLLTHGRAAPQFARSAADPKLTVELPSVDASQSVAAIRRFLAEYVPAAR